MTFDLRIPTYSLFLKYLSFHLTSNPTLTCTLYREVMIESSHQTKIVLSASKQELTAITTIIVAAKLTLSINEH